MLPQENVFPIVYRTHMLMNSTVLVYCSVQAQPTMHLVRCVLLIALFKASIQTILQELVYPLVLLDHGKIQQHSNAKLIAYKLTSALMI